MRGQVLIMVILLLSYLEYGAFANEFTAGHRTESESDAFDEPEIWSSALQEYAINPPSLREGKAIQAAHRYIPTSNVYISKRIGVGPPVTTMKQSSNFDAQKGGPAYAHNQHERISQMPSEISETDLYLLGAIEKLVYRVDYMEKRLRKTEQIVYYLMQGNQNREQYEDPCPHNFTRIGANCYLFGTQSIVNWKTANNICKSYGAHLAELDTLNENSDIVAYLLNHHQLYKGHNNFWLGALNPGLLWIWSSSARPVNPNVNITMIQNQGNKFNATLNKITTGGSTQSAGQGTTTSTTAMPNASGGDATASMEIEGNGRCLNLVYNAAKHMYKFHGMDCMSKRQYLCEIHDKKLSNEISRISKQLFT